MEQRVWLRRKWTRRIAMLDGSGVLKISSSFVYDKLQYSLVGGLAVLIEDSGDRPSKNGHKPPPRFQIRLDPSLQFDSLEGTSILTFRLVSADDVGPWIRALSWCLQTIALSTISFSAFAHPHSPQIS
jgi:hypothetical protein